MRVVLAALLLLPLAACEIVYKLPTRQGNVLEQKDIDKLQLGMTREQVQFIMGTPVATTSFRNDRWDYYRYYKPPRGEPYSRVVSLYFDADKLVRMEGEKAQAGARATPEAEMLKKEQQKAATTEEERAEEEKKSDRILTPPDQQDHKDGGGAGGSPSGN
jgi:outer membrane protein assembly factor BamE (lipoprotein component of BamABCDE complex)